MALELKGYTVKGRLAVIFSALDLTHAGLVGYQRAGVDGYDPGIGTEGSCYRIMRNIVLYSIFGTEVNSAAALATPDLLMEEILRRPPPPTASDEWRSMTSLQKQMARKKYAMDLMRAARKKNFHGKKVSWRVVLDDVETAKDSDGYVVAARSHGGYTVVAKVAKSDGDVLLSLKKGQELMVTGTIESYVTDPTMKNGQPDPDLRESEWFTLPADKSLFKITLSDVKVSPVDAGARSSDK